MKKLPTDSSPSHPADRQPPYHPMKAPPNTSLKKQIPSNKAICLTIALLLQCVSQGQSIKERAEQGDAEAQSALGIMYDLGEGVPEDDAEAVKWYRKAAEQGNADAQCNLGVMYRRGEGVPEDDVEAVKWFRKAAEQGNAKAHYNLGRAYNFGKGVPEDDAEAVKWYRKSAEQGYADAQCILGDMYELGKRVPQDDVEAVKWYRKAAEQGHGADYLDSASGHEKAKKGKEIISRKMTQEQIAEAQKLSREWKPRRSR